MLGYLVVWFGTTAIFSHINYKDILKQPYQAPKRKTRNSREYTDEELEANETKRRKDLAKEAVLVATIMGLFWPLIWFISILVIIGQIFVGFIHRIAISPVEEAREREIAYSKAKRIVVQYEEEQRQRFEKELKGE